jgi:hypothetical protein
MLPGYLEPAKEIQIMRPFVGFALLLLAVKGAPPATAATAAIYE